MSHRSSHTKLIFGIVLGVLVLGLVSFFIFHQNGTYKTITLEPSTLVRTVLVTGEVVPVDEVTLSFTAGGRIETLAVRDGVSVTRGTTLATLDASEVEANIRQATADRTVAEAELAALVGTGDSQGEVAATKQQVLTVLTKAHSVADNQLKTNVDTLFDNPQSGRPQITPAIDDYFARQSIGQERVVIGRLLDTWKQELLTLGVETVDVSHLETAYTNLEQVRAFFRSISQELSDAETTNQVTEARLSEFRSLVTNARTALDAVIDDLVQEQDSLRDVLAQDPVQRARVTSASASIERYSALLKNYTVTAPFAGTVAEVYVTAGEVVAPNQAIVSLVSDGVAELEVFVPEVNIAHVDVGDQAVVTLDAYGSELALGATVTFIDTRATQKNGVVTYRTKLAFNDVPQGVRPGMTATIQIEAVATPDVLLVPQAVVIVTDTGAYVDVLVDGQKERREVVLGMTDTRGGVMVESGLVAGDVVIVGE